jgi:hypothetical protein
MPHFVLDCSNTMLEMQSPKLWLNYIQCKRNYTICVWWSIILQHKN